MESIDDQIKELKRKRQNIYSRQWKLRNVEHTKKRDNLHTKIHNRKKAIPKLQAKIEKYEKEIIQFESEIKKIHKYRKSGMQRVGNKVKKGLVQT